MTGEEQELLSDHTLLGVSPEQCGRRAALQAGLSWESLDEGFVGGSIMISLTGMGLIKARSHLSLQLAQAVLQKMILLLFRNLYLLFLGQELFSSASLPSGTESGQGHSSVVPHIPSPCPG